MKHFDYIPELDGPQSFVTAGGRTILCKGGGGGSSSVYYGNMDNLYGVQAQAAQYMLDNSMPYIPGYMTNSNKMVNESMDGTLAERARATASADAGMALGTSLGAAQRGLERYGTTLNPNAVNANMTNAALSGAAIKSGAMNDAQNWAEGQKWNRNAGAVSQATGMGSGSRESLGGTARGYGAAGASLQQNESLNAAGYGRFGSTVAAGALMKDGGTVTKKNVGPGLDGVRRYGIGGEVAALTEQLQPGGFGGDIANKAYSLSHPGGWMGDKMEQASPGGTLGMIHDSGTPGRRSYLNAHASGGHIKKPGLHLAVGGTPTGNPWTAWKNNNPIQSSQQDSSGSGAGDAIGAVAMGAAPLVLGKGIKAGLSAVKGAMTPAAPATAVPTASTGSGLTTGTASIETGGAMANGAEGTIAAKGVTDTAAAGAGTNAAAATTGAEVAGTAAATDAAAVGVADAAATAGTAATAEAAGAAAAGEMATAAGTSATMGPVGWVAAGALALGALGMSQGWFGATGGSVSRNDPKHMRRTDMTPGGDVSGPGTATSDSIPAWLSDGEHVNNATAVQLAGLDTLETINNAGLSVREGKQSTASAKAKIGKAMIERGQELTGGLELAKGGKVGCKMASGGFLNGNTGIALGAAADEWNKQRVLGMEQALTDLQVKKARPQIELQDDQIAAGRSLYRYQDASNKAGIEALPEQTANAKKQQQLTGIGLDNAITGNAGQKMSYGNKDAAIKILNQAAAAQPGFDGTIVIDVTPQKDGAGVFLHMSDKSKKAISRDEIVGAMGAIKQGDYQAVKDDAGNIFAFDKATGNTVQKVQGDPNNLPGRAKPADVASAEWLINNGVAKDAKSAWDLVRSSREKTRSDFVLDYVSKNAMPGSDITQASTQAGNLYDSLRKSQAPAATQGVPVGAGKSGTNWQDWMRPPQ